MRKYIILYVCTAFLGCDQTTTDTKAEGEKLMQVSREWSKAAASRDVEKTLSYWADDAVMYSMDQAPLHGKEAIRGMVEGSYKIPGFEISWEPESADISKSGDMGYLLERTKLIVNDSLGKPVTQYYRGITIWKKQADGSWKNVVDVLSADSAHTSNK